MKKFMLFAAAASVALVGCVNDEKMEMTSEAKKISFDNPVMATQTRAFYGEIEGANYPTDESFRVFAKQHKGALTDWENASNFWEGALEAKYDGSTYWDTDQDYYWPNSDDNVWLSFGAYSPATLTGTPTVSYLNSGLKIEGFEVASTVAQQVDLMYSGPILDRKYTEENDVDGVDITFKHALSSIVFSAIDNDDNAAYTIKSIKVNGNFVTTGNFSENLTSITDTEDKANWNNKVTDDTEYSLATGLNITVENSATEITTGNSALLTIPHTTTELTDANATVTIEYTVKPTSGADDYDATKTVRLADFKISGSDNSIEEWKRGNRYNYQFSFGGTKKIFFSPQVTNWEDGGTATVTIE